MYKRQVELSSRAQSHARHAERTAIRTLSVQLGELDDELAMLRARWESDSSRLESAHATIGAKDEASRARDAERAAEAADRLYLRNVLLRYLETEDMHTMFPVIATVLRFTEAEVASIVQKKEERERPKKRFFFF